MHRDPRVLIACLAIRLKVPRRSSGAAALSLTEATSYSVSSQAFLAMRPRTFRKSTRMVAKEELRSEIWRSDAPSSRIS